MYEQVSADIKGHIGVKLHIGEQNGPKSIISTGKITNANVMCNMSVSCDCEGVNAAPVVPSNVGILSSTDILALDQVCVDLVYAMTEAEHHDLVERIESRHGLRQLSYMKELGRGNDKYTLSTWIMKVSALPLRKQSRNRRRLSRSKHIRLTYKNR